MTDWDACADPNAEPCYFFSFGLIVTGKGEQEHIPKLFQTLLRTQLCHFKVIRFTGQRSAISSESVKARMVGTGKVIPDKDAEEIGFPARKYLQSGNCHFVILLDDLEEARRPFAREIFTRYRQAFDTVLLNQDQRQRASVHFLANMLEAYYFADAQAINAVFELAINDYDGDVETIKHPKAKLKELCPTFDERRDAGPLLERIRVEHILSKLGTCAYLRTLFAWCVKVLESCPVFESSELVEMYGLRAGELSDITAAQ